MRKPVTLITGAGGEIGHGLVARLGSSGMPIVTLDIERDDALVAEFLLLGDEHHRLDLILSGLLVAPERVGGSRTLRGRHVLPETGGG